MPRKKEYGRCHICGEHGKLSFEHVPPKRAFNDRPVVRHSSWDRLGSELEEQELLPGDVIEQRGMGGYTLCERCNNITGHWYGSDFVEWCYQGLDILIRAEGKPSLIYPHYVLPLRIIKQVVTMFMSACDVGFRDRNEELVEFVLDPERRYLSEKYDFYIYYNLEGTLRFSSVVATLRIDTRQRRVFSEITFPPYGYVMTLNSLPPDPRLFSIRHFATYEYNQFASFEMQLPVLPTFLSLPGDYRTKEQIEIDRIRNQLEAARINEQGANNS